MSAVTRTTILPALPDTSAPLDLPVARATHRSDVMRDASSRLTIHIHSELNTIEAEWRRFERAADCTAFQTFEWLAAWQRHIGERQGVRPVIIVGRFGDGDIAFIVPLAVERGLLARRLCWLGQDLCDYNAPLLARDFSTRVPPQAFLAAWRESLLQARCEPPLRFDWVEFEKMPETVGSQTNPFIYLGVAPNPSNAHLTRLGDDWEKFYFAKRSSATRRRDRAKRRHMSEYGDVRFVTAADADDARRTLEILMQQKSRSLARKGIPDIFAPPGHREFYLELASNPRARDLIHVSRVEIGDMCVAANLGMAFGDCYYHVLASYADNEVAHYGPGALHLRELMAYAISRRLRRFDFTIGDEPYKLDWSDAVLKLYDCTATKNWRGVPARFLSSARRRLKRLIKQTPLLWSLTSQARSMVGSFSRPSPKEPQAAAVTGTPAGRTPLACVMGDMDLLRPLALAGAPCAAVSRPGVPSLYSRYAQSRLVWDDYENNTDRLLDTLLHFGKAQAEPPVLFFGEDSQVLFVSRYRDRLAPVFRFALADAPLIEDLLDKARFQSLAERHALPVPAARCFDPRAVGPADLDLPFPLIIKPVTRLDRWGDAFGLHKALYAENVEALHALWPQVHDLDLTLLAQEFIAGAEDKIESYHCYVDAQHCVAGEFTGRKIRTYPARFGHTTALEITDSGDVRQLGRNIVERLNLTGVAKFDFKRDPHGRLRLLEINPRFSLWHHPGALAGVNIPALVYADLAGLPRPTATQVQAGVRWCRPWKDFSAARAAGLPLTAWMTWTIGCEAKSTLSLDDPLPFARSSLFRLVGRHAAEQETGVWRSRATPAR